jgi:hypothetical protein
MDTGRTIRKRGSGWIIAVPSQVRRWLAISHRVQLYWHCARRGEAVLTIEPARRAGRPEVTRLTRELDAARREIEAIKQRDERRDRGMYAEGYAHGYVQAYERLVVPWGASAERGHRRSLYRWAHRTAADVDDPKQVGPIPAPEAGRPNARTRRARRDRRHAERVAVVGSVDALPSPVAPPSSVEIDGGDAASGAAPPGRPVK